jgi:hypothetical protein
MSAVGGTVKMVRADPRGPLSGSCSARRRLPQRLDTRLPIIDRSRPGCAASPSSRWSVRCAARRWKSSAPSSRCPSGSRTGLRRRRRLR